MPVRSLVLFLILTVPLSAQKKVCQEFAGYKLHMDSMMRVVYGDSLFENCFVYFLLVHSDIQVFVFLRFPNFHCPP